MKTPLTALIVSAAFTASSHATVIALYNFETAANRLSSSDSETLTSASILSSGISGSFTGTTTQNNAGVQVHNQHTDRQSTADSLTFDSPVSGYAVVGQYSDIKTGTGTLANAVAGDIYLGFTVTLDGAASIDLTSFSFGTDITNGTAAKSYWLLADAVDGTFETSDQIGSGSFSANSTQTLTTFSTSTFTSNTTFRLYFNTTASTGSHGFAIDTITLNADVAPIPEPSVVLLGTLSGSFLLRRRR